ncbi:FHA domain-containing protein [Herbiconiux sp.]|uniref:FHA domain-containing protein n=1 Tax=Herbiconiux sp. TaxID=1871186 RepID=UPI0025C3AF9B|nr:FHA domain-containing protein [Herbiconiux sp.]
MTTLHYTPGPWCAVVVPEGVAVLPAGTDAELLEKVWAALQAGEGLGGVLEALTGTFGTSLGSLPPFAVATVSGSAVRLAVRGELTIDVVEGSDAGTAVSLTVSGADVTTWSERVVAEARHLTLRTPESASAQRFGVASGVVLVSAVELDVTGEGVAVSAPATASVAASAPAPVASEVPEATLMTGDGVIEEAAPEAADPETPVEVAMGDEVSEAGPDEVAELEHTRDELPDDAYDHLWGATVVKSVEDAAVRELEEDDESEEVGASSVPVEPPAPSSVPEPPAPVAPPVAPPPPVQSSGLIDSVPGFGGLGAASGSASINGSTVPPAAPAATPAPVTPAAPASQSAPVAPAAQADDDHDGLTVTVSELEAMRRLGAAGGDAPAALPDSALGRIVLSTGETHPLDKPVIIGRRPRANRVQVDRVPVLVTVPSPEQDISRNHLEIRLEGRHVLVVDLDTTNGSVLHREGTPPLRLGPHEPVLVLSRDIVDIGDGVTVTFEEIP